MPFKSHAQNRFFFGSGQIPLSVAKEWASHTDYSKLPKKVRKKVKKKASSPLAQMSSFSAMPGAPAMPSAPTPPTIPTKFGPGTGFGGISMSPTRSRLLKPTLKTDLKPHAPENALTSPIKMAADESTDAPRVAVSDLAKTPSEPLTPSSVIAKSHVGSIIRPGVSSAMPDAPRPIEQLRQPPTQPSALSQYVEHVGKNFPRNPIAAASNYMNFGPLGLVNPGNPLPPVAEWRPSIPAKAGNFTLHVLKCADFALKSMLPTNTDVPKPQAAPQAPAAVTALPPIAGNPSAPPASSMLTAPPASPMLTAPPAQPALNTKPTALDGLARSALPPVPPPAPLPFSQFTRTPDPTSLGGNFGLPTPDSPKFDVPPAGQSPDMFGEAIRGLNVPLTPFERAKVDAARAGAPIPERNDASVLVKEFLGEDSILGNPLSPLAFGRAAKPVTMAADAALPAVAGTGAKAVLPGAVKSVAAPVATGAAENAAGTAVKSAPSWLGSVKSPLQWAARTGIDVTRPVTTALRNSNNPIVSNIGRASDMAMWPLRSATGQQTADLLLRGGPMSLGKALNLGGSTYMAGRAASSALEKDPNLNPVNAYFTSKIKAPVGNYALAKGMLEDPAATSTDFGNRAYDAWRQPVVGFDRSIGTALHNGKNIPEAVLDAVIKPVKPITEAIGAGQDAAAKVDTSNMSPLERGDAWTNTGTDAALTKFIASRTPASRTDLTNPDSHYRWLGPSDEASRTNAAMDFVKGHPSVANGILSRGLDGANPVSAYRDKFTASEIAGDPAASADNWRKYTQSLAVSGGGKAAEQMPIDRPLGPTDFEGIPEAADFGKMIDGPANPTAPGPFAKYEAARSSLAAKYPNMGADPNELMKAKADPLYKEYEAAKRTYQGRAVEHYRDKVVKPLVEPTGLPSMVSRAKSIQEELASGKLSPEATQAKLAELQDVATKVQSGTTKILNYSLARAPLDGLLVKPNDLPPTVQDFMGELSKKEPIKDASGNDTGMTRPATPLGRSFEQAVARDYLKTTGETPTPEQIQSVSSSMPELSKILVLGGLGLGAAGLISAMLGGGSMGAVMGLMGLVGVGAAAAHGYGGGQISSLFQGDTWKRFGMGVQGMVGGRSAPTAASAPNPVENQKYVTLSALQSTPQFQDLAQGKVSPDQANKILSMIHPGEQEAALQALAAQPGIQQTAKAFFERRAAYAAGQPTNPDDMLSAARPAFQAAGIDPNSASEAFKVLDQMRTNPDILYSRAQPVMDMLSQLSSVASDPNRLQALSTKLPPAMRAKLYEALQQHGNNPDLQRFLPPDKIARISAAIKPQ